LTKHLIIGFGTGRSGTTSLGAYLNAHQSVKVLHEGRLNPNDDARPFSWSGDSDAVLNWLNTLVHGTSDFNWVGDIGLYYLNYIPAIIAVYPEARFICMERDKEEVVASYLQWTEGKNHWIVHDGSDWRADPIWDDSYPKYAVNTKAEALEQYWVDYAAQTRAVRDEFPKHIQIVNLRDFNQEVTRDAILDFIGFTGIRNVKTPVHRNSLRDKDRRPFSKQLGNQLLSVKRFVFGRPGYRWYKRLRKQPSKSS
jgi:hypothetical protein